MRIHLEALELDVAALHFGDVEHLLADLLLEETEDSLGRHHSLVVLRILELAVGFVVEDQRHDSLRHRGDVLVLARLADVHLGLEDPLDTDSLVEHDVEVRNLILELGGSLLVMWPSRWDLVEQLLHQPTDDHALLLGELVPRSTFLVGAGCGEIAEGVDHVHEGHHLNQNLVVDLVSFLCDGITLSGIKRSLVLGINYGEVGLLQKFGHLTLFGGEVLMRHVAISDLGLVGASWDHSIKALTGHLSFEELPVHELGGESKSPFEVVFEHLIRLSFNAHALQRGTTAVVLALLGLVLGLFELELEHLDFLLQLSDGLTILLEFHRRVHHALVAPLLDLLQGLHLVHQDLLNLLLKHFVFILHFSQLLLEILDLLVLLLENLWVWHTSHFLLELFLLDLELLVFALSLSDDRSFPLGDFREPVALLK